MEKNLWINRTKLIVLREAEGTKKFFRTLPDGRRIEIETSKENLIDVLNSTLWPLNNLRDILGQDDEPGPMFFLLEDMVKTVALKFEVLCDIIKEEFGGIEIYECNDVVPSVQKDTLLGAVGPSLHNKE